MESLVIILNLEPEIMWMEYLKKEKTLEDKHPSSIGVQGMIYGEVRVKCRPKREIPTLLEL